MRILIIGSKGFIGSHCFNFFSKNHDTWGCDVYTDYNEKNFFLFDVTNAIDHSPFHEQSFDLCINCAGAASVPNSWKSPLRDFQLNTDLVFKILESIRIHNPGCRFINISSAAVYGNPNSLPVSEESRLLPLSPYGKHKLASEEICKEFAQFFQIKTCCLRIFSAYGPGLRKQIFWDWYQKSKEASKMILPGTGKETRDYIHIDDIVKAISLIIDRAAFEGESYNLGSGVQSSIEQAAALFFQKIKWSGSYEFNNTVRPGEPLQWQADITKLKKMGFEPSYVLEDGIENYIKWLQTL